jgi:PhnB protein
MSVTIYINYNGNCREAVEYYAMVFKTEKPVMMLFGDLPSNDSTVMPDELQGRILNAVLHIQGTMLMFSDVPPDRPAIIGNNTSIVISFKDVDELKAVYGKLEAGGTVIMALQETFWTKCYGYLTDKFGVNWMLTLEK